MVAGSREGGFHILWQLNVKQPMANNNRKLET